MRRIVGIIGSLCAGAGLAACAGALPPRESVAPGGDRGAIRTLVVMMDGVPFEVVDSLWRAGRFAEFRPPSRVVSPFPALTQVAFGSIWREAPSEGYEDLYFDRSENRLEGGLAAHVFGTGEAKGFHRHVDVAMGGVLGGLAYLAPGPVARVELRQLQREVVRRGVTDTTVVAYLVSTDALAHRAGRGELVRYLIEVDSVLSSLRSYYGPDLRITLFSDHGNELVPTRRAPLEKAIEAAGFRVARRIESDRDVVIPRFGLVGSAFLYATPASEERLALALRTAPGVDLVLREDDEGRVEVWSRNGHAIVESDEGMTRFRYEPVEGDPLGLAPAMAHMRRAGEIDSEGFAPDAAWFEASLETPYIDSLRRIVTGIRGVVRNPASVVVSFEPGYHYGSRVADAFVEVTGTHGSLRTGSALAFFMSTHVHAPRLVRSWDLLEYVPGILP